MATASERPYRFGFVMEQVFGHRTHYQNLRHFVESFDDIAPTWMPIPFEPQTRLTRLPGVRSNWSVRASTLAWQAVRRARTQTPFDALLYHTQVTSLLSPLHRGIPTVISLDATPINYDSVGAYYDHSIGGRSKQFKHNVNVWALRSADALITWCGWARDSLVDDYGVPAERIHVIAPGVDLTAWPQRSGEERVRASEGRLPRLLFVGGDFERKGGNVLLDAFTRQLAGRCELHIVTQQPLEPRPNLFVYNGVTPNSPTLVRLFAEADLFVFPTLADCAPLAVPEAMAASLPVISTPVGAIPEMVRPARTGWLVRPNDADALAAAIDEALVRPELRAQMGDAARRVVEQEYDAARNAQRLLDVLRHVAEPRARELRGAAQRVPARPAASKLPVLR